MIKKSLNHPFIDRLDIIESNDDSIISQLVHLVQKHKIAAVLPAGQAPIVISHAKPRIAPYCKVFVEDYEKMIRFHDKSQSLLLAKELSIPHPRTYLPRTFEEAKYLAHQVTYPVVIKSRKGTGARGVWYAVNPKGVIARYEQCLAFLQP